MAARLAPLSSKYNHEIQLILGRGSAAQAGSNMQPGAGSRAPSVGSPSVMRQTAVSPVVSAARSIYTEGGRTSCPGGTPTISVKSLIMWA